MPEPKEEAKKTLADVADRMLDGVEAVGSPMIEGAKQIIEEMNSKLPQVWEGLVMYHRAQAISDLIYASLIGLFFLYVFHKCVLTVVNKDSWSERRGEPTGQCVASIIVGGLSLLLVLMCFASVSNTLPDAMVPERAAALEIIEALK